MAQTGKRKSAIKTKTTYIFVSLMILITVFAFLPQAVFAEQYTIQISVGDAYAFDRMVVRLYDNQDKVGTTDFIKSEILRNAGDSISFTADLGNAIEIEPKENESPMNGCTVIVKDANTGEDIGFDVYQTKPSNDYDSTVFSVTGNASYTLSQIHKFEETNRVEATCTQVGSSYSKCKYCGKEETFPIFPLGHDYKDSVIPPTCVEKGYTTHICTRCNDTITDTYVEATGHKWNSEYTVDKKATYAVAGSKSIHCSACDTTKPNSAVSIPKLKVKTPTVSKPKAIKKGFVVKWKKVSGVTGYELQYALNSKFTKSKKAVKLKKAATVSKKITKLKVKKKYYVRIRAYKVFSGKRYYSSWSKVKKVKTK